MAAAATRMKLHICDLLMEHTPSVIKVQGPDMRLHTCRRYGTLRRKLSALIKKNPEAKVRLHLVYTHDGAHERTVFLNIARVGDVTIDHEIWIRMPNSAALRSAVFIRNGRLKPRLHKDEVEKYRLTNH